jgi:hypothetical protein
MVSLLSGLVDFTEVDSMFWLVFLTGIRAVGFIFNGAGRTIAFDEQLA